MDNNNNKYISIKLFRDDLSCGKIATKTDIELAMGKPRVLCNDCKGYEVRTQKCLQLHRQAFHKNQEFEKGYRPRDHRCHWGGECVELLEEQSKDAENKFKDSDGIIIRI